MSGWIGVGLDGCLAHYEPGDRATYGFMHIGRAIPQMVERVKQWLAEGRDVRIFTSRIAGGEEWQRKTVTTAIKIWCVDHFGQPLQVTCTKDAECEEIWDDTAVQVVRNIGQKIGRSRIEPIRGRTPGWAQQTAARTSSTAPTPHIAS